MHSAVGFENEYRIALWGFVAPYPRKVEAAGLCYEASQIRDRILLGYDDGKWLSPSLLRKLTFSDLDEDFLSVDDSSIQADLTNQNDDAFDEESDAYERYLERLDPKEWKDQDHYKVLGLSKLRHLATEDQIRTACKD